MMVLVSPAEIQPVVRIANYHDVCPGRSWSNRCIPDLQLIFLIQGNYEYLEEGQAPVNLMAGEVLLIEPGRWHTFRSVDRNGTGWISGLHFEFTGLGAWAAGDYRLAVAPERVTRVVDVTYLHERFKRLAQVYRSYQPYREFQTSAIAREIMLILVGHWRQPSGPDLSPRMQEMINFIRANLREPLNRQALAKAFRLSPEHINLLFRQELGMTPSSVINRERVMVAYRLIHEKAHSVKEAAYEVGYSDPFYFSRVFKMIFGIPPSHIV